MSNPRRFGKAVLHRVTRAMPLDKAKRKAATIRKSGVQARVDTYQGRYAVWSVKSAGKDYAEELRLRKRLGHICGTCEHFAANTKFKKWGGKDIVPNQCMQGRRRTTDPPFIVSPDSPCILSFDLWKPVKSRKPDQAPCFVSGRMQLLTKTQIKDIVAKQNRVYIEETGEPMADKYQKALGRILGVMPIIPRGKNVGSMDWHNCEGNAIAHFKSTGDIAFIGFLITGYKEPLRHAFNVKDGKVLEMTGGIKWTKNKQYVGVPIPPKEMAKYKYQRKDWNVQWLKAQRAEISFR